MRTATTRIQAWLLITTTVFLFMLVSVMGAFLHPNKTLAGTGSVVSIFIDDREQVVTTDATTVGEVLERAGVAVGPADLVEPGLDTQILSGSFHINIYRARPVLVVDGETSRVVSSPYRSPKLVAERSAGLTVYPEDTYQVELIRDFTANQAVGLKVTVGRATPAEITVDGTTIMARSHARTVGELLKEKGIALDGDDTLNVDPAHALKAHMKIVATRVGHQVLAFEEPIARTERVIYDDNLPEGTVKVQEEGSDGARLATYTVRLHNGAEVLRTEVQSVTVREPAARVIVRGSRKTLSNYDDPFAALRMCESTNNYAVNTGNGYYGAYQFNITTWDSVASRHSPSLVGVRPDLASPADQDLLARKLQSERGWQPWPACRSKLGLP